jgi:hypothetical protein
MNEEVFFEGDRIKVTNSRFVVGNQTHAINGVTSVSSHVTPPSRIGLIIGAIVGLFVLGAGGWAILVGLGVTAACSYMLYLQKPTHTVILRSASGEVEALSSTDAGMIGGVITALNSALIHRG